jgi:hypothetical protein
MNTDLVPPAEQTPSRSKKKRFLLVIPIILILLIGGFGSWYYFFYKKTEISRVIDVAPPPLRENIPVPKVLFTDATVSAGLKFTHYNGASGKKLLPETMGSGVCVFDFDGDGLQDVLFLSGCPWPGHKGPEKPITSCLTLYRNKGDGTFEDVTAAVGLTTTMYAMGACAGDIDNDGFPDLFITGIGGCKLFRNVAGPNGKRKFVDATKDAGFVCLGQWPGHLSAEEFLKSKEPIEFASTAAFLDFDGDGRLDLFVCRYVTWSPAFDLSIEANLIGVGRAFLPPTQFEGSQCALYRNVGGGKFQDVTNEAGINVYNQTLAGGPNRPVGKALGVVVCDADNDGWPDIIVANDTVRNFFFHNVPAPDGGRMFKEIGLPVGVAYAEGRARGAMGIDWGEYSPGKHGAVIANFANEPLTFLTKPDPNKLRFTDTATATCLAGPSKTLLKFGTFFFDYDLDGRLDILVCNGHLEPEISKVQANQFYAQPPQLFWNTGKDDHLFEPVDNKSSGDDLFKPLVGRGSAYLNFNGDGLLDVILVENNGPARLLRNDSKLGNKYIRLTLVGDGRTSNTSAIGAQVTVEAGGQTHRRDVTGTRGYLSQSELPVTVGLGTTDKVDKITVRWPGKEAGTQVWTNLNANSRYTLRQGKADAELTDLKK